MNMKALLKLTLALIFPAMLVAMPGKSQAAPTPADCKAMVMQLKTATDAVTLINVTPNEATKIKADLTARLDKALLYLNYPDAKSQYNAANQVWEYRKKLRGLFGKKISDADFTMLDTLAGNTTVCIVKLYCPACPYTP